MTTNKFFKMLIAAFAVMTAVSCNNKNTNTPQTTITPPAAAAYRQVLDSALSAITQTQTFTAENGISFTSKGGVSFTINPNTVTQSGNPVTGNVTLQLVELYKRGDMLVTNKPLIGTAIGGATGPLITGGEFYINLTQNGQPVNAMYTMIVPAANTGATLADDSMTLWTGIINDVGNLAWNQQQRNNNNNNIAKGNSYNIISNNFGWTNIDKLSVLPNPKAQIWAQPPTGFDSSNCAFYVVYNNEPGALAYLDTWNSAKQMFTEHYGLAPIGMSFNVVFASVQTGGQYIYAIKNVTVADGMVITFKTSDLIVTDKNSLISIINNLP